MSTITRQTRRASYDAIKPKVNPRSRMILEVLGDRAMTVSEIVEEMVATGKIPHYDRNRVAPRLTEMKAEKIVETCGRKKSSRTGASEAIWRRKKAE